jgi:hypothetical protein
MAQAASVERNPREIVVFMFLLPDGKFVRIWFCGDGVPSAEVYVRPYGSVHKVVRTLATQMPNVIVD